MNRISADGFPPGRGTWQALLLLMGVSLAVKTVILVASPVITPDGPIYIAQAEAFLKGDWQKGLSLHGNMFLYPLLIAGGSFVVSDLVLAGRLLSLAFSVSTLVPLFLLSRNLFGPRVALWTGLAFAVTPGLNEYSVYVMRDPGFLCMFAWALYFALRAIEFGKIRDFSLMTAFSVLAFLFRLEGGFLLGLFPAFALLYAPVAKAGRAPLLKGALGFLVFFSICCGVVYAFAGSDLLHYNRLQEVFGFVQKPFENGLFSYNPLIKEQLEKMELLIPYGSFDNDFAEIAQEHIRLIYVVGLVACLNKVVHPLFFLALVAGLGMARTWRPGHLFLLFVSLSYLFMDFFHLLHRGFLEARFVYPALLLLLPWAGYGLEKLSRAVRKTPFPNAGFILFAVLFFLVPGVESATDVKRQMVTSKMAGEWLEQHPEMNTGVIAANNREIPFYSGRGVEFVPLPDVDADRLAEIEGTAIQHNAQLLGLVQRFRKERKDPQFEAYDLVQKFTDDKYASYIYRKKP